MFFVVVRTGSRVYTGDFFDAFWFGRCLPESLATPRTLFIRMIEYTGKDLEAGKFIQTQPGIVVSTSLGASAVISRFLASWNS